jgi:hypothetical protein
MVTFSIWYSHSFVLESCTVRKDLLVTVPAVSNLQPSCSIIYAYLIDLILIIECGPV